LCSHKQLAVVASPLPFSDHLARATCSRPRSSGVLLFWFFFFGRYLTPVRYSADPQFFGIPSDPAIERPAIVVVKNYTGQNTEGETVGDQGRTRPPCRQYNNLRTSSAMVGFSPPAAGGKSRLCVRAGRPFCCSLDTVRDAFG
jgi:hypothetical protein